jgi:membrane-associated phospholipid phosphatase
LPQAVIRRACLAWQPSARAARKGIVLIRTCDVRPGARHTTHPVHRPVHAVVHWPARVAAGTWRRLIKEIFLIAGLAVIYEEIRDHMVQAGAAAAGHALLIVSAERSLGLFRERAVQDAIIGSDTVTDAFNAYYGGTHFLIPILVLAWLMFRHPAHYARARTALAAITGLAFIVFWLFPVAPPRLLPARFGIIDTLVAGSGHIEGALISAAGDQYASMPSVHVAWAVWCALAVYPVARHWAVRALAVAYPLVTMLVVVATGNHFFLDVIAGALLACVTWVAVTRGGAWLSVRIATRRSHREPGRWRTVGARPASAGARPASVGAPDGGPVPRTARPGGELGGPAEGDQVAA